MKFRYCFIIFLSSLFGLVLPACHHKSNNNETGDIKKPPKIPDHSTDSHPTNNCSTDHNSNDTAIPVADSEFKSSENICPEGIVTYRLDVSSRTIFNVSLEFEDPNDLDLYLFDKDDNEITSSYYYNPEELEFTLEDGQYYLVVYGYNIPTATSAAYTLSINQTPGCYNDNDCDDDQYCNTFAGDICTPRCTTNDDCIYAELSCVPATGECIWGECLSNSDCTIFGTNAPHCIIELNENDFTIASYCAKQQQQPHCVNDNDKYEQVTAEISTNDNLLEPYAVNVGISQPVRLENATVCNNDSGDFYQIIPSSGANEIVDLEVKISGTSSLYFTGGLFDRQSGRMLDGGSFDIQDWESCSKGTLREECRNGKCKDRDYNCDLEVTFRAPKITASDKLLLVVSRFQLDLLYYQDKEISASLTKRDKNEAIPYTLEFMVTPGTPCTSDTECSATSYPRTKCVGSCQADASYKAYGSNLGEPCLDYLDCNLRDDFGYYCSRTANNPAKNFCTMECTSAADCADIHHGRADDYTCNEGLCYSTACDTAADCPYNDIFHQYCQEGSCIECRDDNDCNYSREYPYCNTTYHTCGNCRTSQDCTSNPNGTSCIVATIDDPYTFCGCHLDTDCTNSNAHRCLIYDGYQFGSCGCENDDDCANGYSCLEITGTCYKKN